MFRFMKLKVYRRTFWQYLIIVTLIFILASAILVQNLLANEEARYTQKSEQFFSSVESRITRVTSSIDLYMTRLYSNPDLLADFLSYFNNDIENYLESTLNDDSDPETTPSFLRDFKLFVRENDFLIREVLFCAEDYTNRILFSENGGAEYSFNVSISSLEERDLSEGYQYPKTITVPGDFSKELGQIIFFIDFKRILETTDTSALYNGAVVSQGTVYHFLPGNGLIDDKTALSIYHSTSQDEMFPFPYYVGASAQHSYKLITAASRQQLFLQSINFFILLLGLLFLVYLLTMILLLWRLNQDAKSLQNILSFIEAAQNGAFHEISVSRKNDEYTQIAVALEKMGRNIQRYIDREYVLTLEQQKAHMRALQNQINPHFLYNTLEIIRYRAQKNDQPEVSLAIENLGSLYRDIVREKENITIGKELTILTRYLDLMQFRYPQSFSYQIDVPDEIKKIPTIKCWMQPIAENFFKYGFDKSNEFNFLFVEGIVQSSVACIRFINNGYGIPPDRIEEINRWFCTQNDQGKSDSKEIGLKNVWARLHILYGSSFSMKIENRETMGVMLSVFLPSTEKGDDLCIES